MAIRTIRKPEYERLLKLNAERITIGVHANDGAKQHPNLDNGEPITVAEVAAKNELGIGVPRRSWLTDWTNEKLAPGTQLLKNLPLDFAPELAARAEASITDRIRSGDIPPPNAESTVKRKGHDRTLIDTETFVNSVHARVVSK